MKRLRRVLKWSVAIGLLFVAIAAALLGYFVYTPDAPLPALSGRSTRGTVDVGGAERTYRVYVPRALPKHAALVVVMHGSGESGAQIRMETGYRFDRLADEHGFAVVYPDARTFDWNDCSRIGDFVADGREVDDVGFVLAMVDRLVAEHGLDRDRVFATGVSAGGFMALRLALEAPSRVRAVAAVSAGLPTPENSKCRAMPGASVMLMNGTADPIVPYEGGEVALLGLFYRTGPVLPSVGSAASLATLNGLVEAAPGGEAAAVARRDWRGDQGVEVALVTIVGGGHGMPQAAWRRPRLLGPSPMAPDGPALIWAFFDRQRRSTGGPHPVDP